MDPWNVAQVGLWVIVLFHVLLTLGLLRRVADLSRARGRGAHIGVLGEGQAAPGFEAEAWDGSRIGSNSFGAVRLLIGFFSPTCPSCLDHFASFMRLGEKGTNGGISSVAAIDADRQRAADLVDTAEVTRTDASRILLAPRDSNTLFNDYKVEAYPAYAVVSPTGTIEAAFGAIWEVEEWLAHA